MKFSTIPGLQKEKKRLIDSFKSNEIHHATLLFGEEGTANLSLAISFSSYINCENRTDTDSCGECPPCSKIKKLIHPDVNLIFPVAPTTKISKEVISDKFVESWRVAFTSNPYINIQYCF